MGNSCSNAQSGILGLHKKIVQCTTIPNTETSSCLLLDYTVVDYVTDVWVLGSSLSACT
jgi:hypothetical protein